MTSNTSQRVMGNLPATFIAVGGISSRSNKKLCESGNSMENVTTMESVTAKGCITTMESVSDY